MDSVTHGDEPFLNGHVAHVWIHPYVEKLAARLASRADRRTVIKGRTLLHGFGYQRRTEHVVEQIHSLLAAGNLETDLDLEYPRDIDDRISVRLLETTASNHPNIQARIGAGTSASESECPGGVSPSDSSFDLSDIAERAVAATVTIYTPSGLGSAFIVHADGLVVTGCHVVTGDDGEALRTVQIRLSDDTEAVGTVFRFHRRLDFALLWLEGPGPFPSLSIGEPRALRSAETVLVIGSPSALRNTVSSGIVSNPRQLWLGLECIQTDACIDHGDSGGPLINRHGEAVGINLWSLGTVDSARFALPLDYLTGDLSEAIRRGRAQCLESPLCSKCGFVEYEKPTWFCRNCGVLESLDTREPPNR